MSFSRHIGDGRDAAQLVVLGFIPQLHAVSAAGAHVAVPAFGLFRGVVNAVDERSERFLIRKVAVAVGVAVLAHLHGRLNSEGVAQIDMRVRHGGERFCQVVVAGVASFLVRFQIIGVVGHVVLGQMIGVRAVQGGRNLSFGGRALDERSVFALFDDGVVRVGLDDADG